jgi:simple sugar transport system permease protein
VIARSARTAIALWAALLVTSALIRLSGRDPLHIYALLLSGTWGNPYGIGQVLFKATPLLFCGLSVSIALRGGLFNVGAEGQITVGAFACAMCAAWLPAATPSIVAVPLSILAAMLGGALVGVLPGWWRATRGAHEVITTIMLNFVVRALMVGVGTLVFLRESVHTRPIIANAQIARLSRFSPFFRGSAANLSFFVAIAIVLGCGWALWRTRHGLHLRAVGAQPKVAAAVGISVARVTIWTMTIAGAIAGLGGANFVLGYKGYYEDGFSGGVGFVGIAVAVLGGAGPWSLILAALLFGTLAQGALAVNAVCPKEIIDVLQAVVIIAVASARRSK